MKMGGGGKKNDEKDKKEVTKRPLPSYEISES